MRSDLGFCHLSGRTVVLDERQDRYFCLGSDATALLHQATEGQSLTDAHVARLSKLGFITDSTGTDKPLSQTLVAVPEDSLVEQRRLQGISLVAAPDVSIALVRAHWLLRYKRFGGTLAFWRDRKAPSRQSQSNLKDWVQEFHAIRRLLPIKPICLTDSLALLHFLWRRGVRPQLVLGVRLEPFAAHCWLQTDTLILNESVDHARAFRPIQVV